jgi:exopolyphosphatase/guanosine-5'-triphosphate,3'-diphosphate pyrophosphatase
MRKAVIDLGTNTFHLFIVEINEKEMTALYKEKIAVKLGQNGISKGKIARDAMKRALHTLGIYKGIIDQFEVQEVLGIATSAIRNAKNGQELVDAIKEQTDITIKVIDGDREAELIYNGVKAAMNLGEENNLIMDIGGGSVEFIIGNQEEILWKQSFEIGAQRLLDQFHAVDPMPASSLEEIFQFLDRELASLRAAIKAYRPKTLIGCSGTFDTLCDIYNESNGHRKHEKSIIQSLPFDAYRDIHRQLLIKNKEERLLIPGMASMRVDMIVVASCLISYVMEFLQTEEIIASSYALKEGLLHESEQKPIAQTLS